MLKLPCIPLSNVSRRLLIFAAKQDKEEHRNDGKAKQGNAAKNQVGFNTKDVGLCRLKGEMYIIVESQALIIFTINRSMTQPLPITALPSFSWWVTTCLISLPTSRQPATCPPCLFYFSLLLGI